MSADVVYAGYGGSDTAKPAAVILETADGTPIGELRHIVRHSPTGFSWGYAGSGPADLARSLLADALGEAARCPVCAGVGLVVWVDENAETPAPYDPDVHGAPGFANRCWDCDASGIRADLPYQDFKFDVIAALPQGGSWKLPRAEVLAWCARNGLSQPA